MNYSQILFCLAIGGTAGSLSGMVGIGGGIVVVPALVLLLGMSQHTAQGTTLAMMVPPIGLLAAWTYYRQGFVDLPVATWVAVGFVCGGLLGARLAVVLSETVLERVFAVTLILVGIKILFRNALA